MKLEHCYNYLFQKYNVFSNQKHRDEENSYIFNHAQIDRWSKRGNGDKIDKNELSIIKNSLINCASSYIYIIAACAEGMEKI